MWHEVLTQNTGLPGRAYEQARHSLTMIALINQKLCTLGPT